MHHDETIDLIINIIITALIVISVGTIAFKYAHYQDMQTLSGTIITTQQ